MLDCPKPVDDNDVGNGLGNWDDASSGGIEGISENCKQKIENCCYLDLSIPGDVWLSTVNIYK